MKKMLKEQQDSEKEVFEKRVSKSLLRLHSTLAKEIDFTKVQTGESYKDCWFSVVFLYSVATKPSAYCIPGKNFDENMAELGFDVAKHHSLFTLNKKAAQCVYDIMICVHDYIFFNNKEIYDINKTKAFKYKSKDEVVAAMRLFERDSIILTGGFVVNGVRDLWNFMFNRSK